MRRHGCIHLALALVVLLIASPGLAAVDELIDAVPADASFVLQVGDVQRTLDEWQASSLAALWRDPQVSAFFAPLRHDLEIDRWDAVLRAETGSGLDEIRAMLNGGLVVYLEQIEVAVADGEEDLDLSMVALAEVGSDAAKLNGVIVQRQAGTRGNGVDADDAATAAEPGIETREFRGLTVYVSRVRGGHGLDQEIAWTIVDGVWVVASPVEAVERAVGRILDGGAETPLRAAAAFATVTGFTRPADGWVFVNIEPWKAVLETVLEAGLATAQEAGSPFPVESSAVIEALGMNAMQAFFAAVDFEDRATVADLGLTFTDNVGLVKVLAYGPGAAPRSTLIPADTTAFTTAAFDFATAWSALVEVVNGINPALLGFAAMQLESSVQNAGVELDLKRDLLDNLTGEVVSIQNFQGISGASLADLRIEQEQVFAVGIRQPEALERVVAGLSSLVGQGAELFTGRDFEGHTIFTLGAPQADGSAGGTTAAYAITDNYLVVSTGAQTSMEKLLHQAGAKGGSVWTQPMVSRSVGLLPAGANSIQYQDMAALGDLIFRGLAVAEGARTDSASDRPRLCDPAAVPEPGTVGRYLSTAVNGIWKDDRALRTKTIVLSADAK